MAQEETRPTETVKPEPAEIQLHYLLQQHFLMQSFHVNEKIDLETLRFCLNYLL